MTLSHYVRDLLLLKTIINAVISNLGTDSDKIEFVSSFTVYDYNNGAIVVARSPRMTFISKNIAVKYHWFKHNIGK